MDEKVLINKKQFLEGEYRQIMKEIVTLREQLKQMELYASELKGKIDVLNEIIDSSKEKKG